MKKCSIVLIIVLVCSVFVSCRHKTFDKALLWKISGNGLDEPSYILGTNHLIGIDFLDSISGFEEAFSKVEQVVVQISTTPEDLVKLKTKTQQHARFAVGEGYGKLLSPEDYTRLDNALKKVFNVGLSYYGKFKPRYICALVVQNLYSKVDPNFNLQNHQAIDTYLQRIALTKGKLILSLETVDNQIYTLFESESLKSQAENLICALENLEWGEKMLVELSSLYKEKALSKMYDLSFNNRNDPCSTSLRKKNILSKDRNQKWLKKLPDIINSKATLIAVGCLHLAGEEGLLSQLSQMGYTVEAVK